MNYQIDPNDKQLGEVIGQASTAPVVEEAVVETAPEPTSAPIIKDRPLGSRPRAPRKPRLKVLEKALNDTLGTPALQPSKKDAKKASSGLTTSVPASKSVSTEAAAPATSKRKAPKMAAKKKAAKKAAKKATAKNATAAKPTKGAPREGTTAAKLLAMASKKGGATLAEMLKLTGWKECRGTLLELSRRVGKKIIMHKGEGNKASRWEVS